MAWTGTPVVKLVSDALVRITGVSLGAGADGAISLFGDGGEIELPEGFQPRPCRGPAGDTVDLVDSVQTYYLQELNVAGESRHIHVDKTEGPPFLITYANDGAQATSNLEIYVRFH